MCNTSGAKGLIVDALIFKVIKQVKGSTSHWVNQQEDLLRIITHDFNRGFSWQTGYAAYSVSESVLDKVFQYIKNQKQHHQKRTFQQEFEDFVKLYNIEK